MPAPILAVAAVASLPVLYIIQAGIDEYLDDLQKTRKRRAAARILRKIETEMRAESAEMIVRRIERML